MRSILTCFALTAAVAWPQVLFDNDQVRVVMASNKPGQKSRMHKHDVNRVMVHLDAGGMKLAHEDGTVRDVKFQAGEVRWDPKVGMHTSENTGGTAYRIVEIELKNDGSGPVKYPALDPVKTDPARYKVLLDNDQVRVVRARFGPHEKTPMHEHGLPRVTVLLTDMHFSQTLPDGKTVEVKAARHQVAMAGLATHSEVNLSAEPFEIIAVELKAR